MRRVTPHCAPTSADCILDANVCASITALIAFSVNFSKMPAVTTKPTALRRSAADAGDADFNLVPSRLERSTPLPSLWGEPPAAEYCTDALPTGLLTNKHAIVDPLPLLLAGIALLRYLSTSMTAPTDFTLFVNVAACSNGNGVMSPCKLERAPDVISTCTCLTALLAAIVGPRFSQNLC